MKKFISVFIIILMLSAFMLSGCSSDAEKYNTVLTFHTVDAYEYKDLDVSAEELSAEKAVIEARLSAIGITDYEIDTDESDDTLTVKFNRPDNIKAENDEDVINYEGDIAN